MLLLCVSNLLILRGGFGKLVLIISVHLTGEMS